MNTEMKILSALVAGGAAAAAVGLVRSGYERRHFVVEETSIYSEKIRNPRTLVFLTDLHDKEFGEANSQLLGSIRTIRPDLILIGGDIMVAKPGKASLEVTRRFLDGLCQVQTQTTGENSGKPFRIYYGNGNHEQRLGREYKTYGEMYREFRRILKQRNISYLSDRSVNLSEEIRISGLNLDSGCYRDFVPARMTAEYLERHLGPADDSRFQILLAHSPLYFEQYADWGADLTLSGSATVRSLWWCGFCQKPMRKKINLCLQNRGFLLYCNIRVRLPEGRREYQRIAGSGRNLGTEHGNFI